MASDTPEPAAPERRVWKMQRFDVTISSSGKPAALIIPADCTESELFELLSWAMDSVRQAVLAQRAAIAVPGKPGLVLPT